MELDEPIILVNVDEYCDLTKGQLFTVSYFFDTGSNLFFGIKSIDKRFPPYENNRENIDGWYAQRFRLATKEEIDRYNFPNKLQELINS